MRQLLLVLTLLPLAVCLSCSDAGPAGVSSGKSDVPANTSGQGSPDTITSDGISSDGGGGATGATTDGNTGTSTGGSTGSSTTGGETTGGETSGGSTVGGGTGNTTGGQETTEQPGDPDDYDACSENSDCASGWCVQGYDGKVCTQPCIENCPAGWSCQEVQNTGTDLVYVCLPKWAGLCRPCMGNTDCPWPAVCHEYGPGGSFCGTTCMAPADCPAGYSCETGLCVRQDAECECDGEAIKTNAKTTCSASNELGTCSGERHCQAEGLTACDAATPLAEVCDGVDNDCDAILDEDTVGKECTVDNQWGSCAGTTTCEAATPGCDGPQPAQDLCDGQDNDCDGAVDEDDDDLDGDGISDCVDDDLDGDGVLNTEDNCESVPNADQLDTDNDALGNACDLDDDNDTVADGEDNCPAQPNLDQADLDNDTVGDACDGDKDGDEVPNGVDNCPLTANPDQADLDNDGVGDACSNDWDGDGVPNAADNCAKVQNADQLNSDDDALGNACDDDDDGDGDPDGQDCKPLDKSVHHAAVETCNSKDDDCDDLIDEEGAEGCAVWYFDGDKDGFGLDASQKCLCVPEGQFIASKGGDCNDAAQTANPLALETCDNIDNDCDNKADEPGAVGCQQYYVDSDKDGWGVDGTQQCQCAPSQDHPTQKAGDCDDNATGSNPGMPEVCGGGDENCNKQVDEENALGCATFYQDSDGDGWGADALSKCLCKGATPFTTQKKGDCNDNAIYTFPGAPELCDVQDNNCNTLVDEGSPQGCSTYFSDPDGDGYAANGAASACLCAPEPPFIAQQTGDCKEFDTKVNPTADEICDGKDNNCNNAIDEGHADSDNDGSKDCVDLDDDNDGTNDVSDCQPYNNQIPSCAGKQCGTDGCGKSCGSCPANGCTVPNTSCMNQSRCQSVVNAEKSASSQWSCTSCGDVDFSGQCWADDVVVWCENGTLTQLKCQSATYGAGKCIFKAQYQWYDCSYPGLP